ncbi:MAG: hypothetical protein RL215_3483 [Planctomycetota bacterium]
MFLECLQRDGFALRLFALPRHRWVFDKSEAPLDVRRIGRWTAEIGAAAPAGRLAAVFCFHWIVLPLAVVLGGLLRVPVIYDEHDHYELNTLEGEGSRRKRVFLSRCVRWIHRLFLPWVSVVTCIHQCGGELQRHLQRWQLRTIELHNYPSRIWSQLAAAREPVPVSSPLCFVYIGGVYAEKGVLTAAEAFCSLGSEVRGRSELHIFGDGDPTVIERLRQLPGVNVHNNIAPAGFRDFAVRRRCVGLALLADTPRYQLVGSNCTKLWEYLALGMPVIVSDVGELPDAVQEHSAGLVISAALHPVQLAEAMTRLVEDSVAAEAMSCRAAALMQNPEMTWEAEWKKLWRALPAGSNFPAPSPTKPG